MSTHAPSTEEPLVRRDHFSLSRQEFVGIRRNVPTRYRIERVQQPSIHDVRSRVSRIEYNWINKPIYDPQQLRRRIQHRQFRLYELFDDVASGESIGYAIFSSPDPKLFEQNVLTSNTDRRKPVLQGRYIKRSTIEFENVALFPRANKKIAPARI